MKRIDWKDKHIRIGVITFCVVGALMLLWHLLEGMGNTVTWLGSVLEVVQSALTPFVIGAVLAYFMFPIVRKIKQLFLRLAGKKVSDKGLKRLDTLAILLTFILIIATVTIIISYIVPELIDDTKELSAKMTTTYQTSIQPLWNQLIGVFPELPDLFPDLYNDIVTFMSSLTGDLSKWTSGLSTVLSSMFKTISSIAGEVLSWLMGLTVSYYLLNERESLKIGCLRLSDALLGEKRANRFRHNIADINHICSRFIVGRMFESLIVGILSFIGFLIIGSPYSLLLAVVNGVFNMIPYFGPFIGGVLISVLVLLDSPELLWIMVGFLVAVQFVDAYILAPNVLGDRIGLSPFWVVFGVSVGGGLFGPVGMFIGVPVAGIIGLFLTRYIRRRIGFRDKDMSMPISSEESPLA